MRRARAASSPDASGPRGTAAGPAPLCSLRTGLGPFIVSLRRLSRDRAWRDRTIRSLVGEGERSGAQARRAAAPPTRLCGSPRGARVRRPCCGLKTDPLSRAHGSGTLPALPVSAGITHAGDRASGMRLLRRRPGGATRTTRARVRSAGRRGKLAHSGSAGADRPDWQPQARPEGMSLLRAPVPPVAARPADAGETPGSRSRGAPGDGGGKGRGRSAGRSGAPGGPDSGGGAWLLLLPAAPSPETPDLLGTPGEPCPEDLTSRCTDRSFRRPGR